MTEYIIEYEEVERQCRSCFDGSLFKEEIVRCCDCKHLDNTNDVLHCMQHNAPCAINGFCAWAERRQ